MNKCSLFVLLAFLFLLAACSESPCQPAALPSQSFDPASIKAVSIAVDTGDVSVTGSQANAVLLSGSQACAQGSTVQVASDKGVLSVTGTAQKRLFQDSADTRVEISLQVPANVPVQVTTDDATVSVSQYDGSLKVDSVAGDVNAQGLAGEAQLRSGRGNVTLTDSAGIFHVLGEHGVLDIENS
ncbi:MAG TPA: hypothetical protein VMC62_03595, partial [Longilinea sp.]|nr:hypothetical protein [Longilinea sp.]